MDSNTIYQKIKKYAYNALNPEVKTFLRGRGKYSYDIIDTSVFATNNRVDEVEGKIDAKLDKDEAAKTYQPIGDYATVTYVDNADTLLNNALKLKQDALTAGIGISIDNNIISCTIDTTLYKVVTALPAQPDEGDENKIFLVPGEQKEDKNIYVEYLYVNGTWEKIGEISTTVDLSDYYTKEETYNRSEINDMIATATGGGITSITASGSDNLILQATQNGAAVTITGSVDLSSKQDTLIAGENIAIDGNVISAASGGQGSLTTVTAKGTAPLTLSASVSGETATITGSVDAYSKSEVDNMIDTITENLVTTDNTVYNLYDGIFAVCTRPSDGDYCLARLSSIKEEGFAGYTWQGAAIVEGGKILIVSMNNAPTPLPIASSSKLFGTAKALAEAVIDLDGAGNTDAILQGSTNDCVTNTSAYAAGYCNNYSTSGFPAGSWYLPSFYEFLLIKKYLREINYAMSLIGGDAIIYENVAGSGYWTSTERNNVNNWVLNTYETHLTAGSKVDLSRNVRPVTTFGHTNNATPTGEITITQQLEITSFSYPSSTFSYEAHNSVDVNTLSIILHTYQDGVLQSSTDVTNEIINSSGISIKSNVDWITVPAMGMKAKPCLVNIAENTTQNSRTGTVHLTATYQNTLTAETNSTTITQEGAPTQYGYSLEFATLNYTSSAGLNTIPAEGGTFSPNTSIVLYTIDPNSGAKSGTTVKADSMTFSMPTVSYATIDTTSGQLTFNAQTSETARTISVSAIAYYTAPDGTLLSALHSSVSITQVGKEVDTSYSLETESVTYNSGNTIPAAGGSFFPTAKVILRTLKDGVITNSEYVTIAELDCTYQTSGDTWLTCDNTHTGAITVAVNTTTSIRTSTVSVVYKYTAPNGNQLSTDIYYITVTQAASTEEQAKISFGESEVLWTKDTSNPPSMDIDKIDFSSFFASATFYNTAGSDIHNISWQSDSYSCVGYDTASYLPCTVVDTLYWSTATHLQSMGFSFITEDDSLYATNCNITATVQYIVVDDTTQQEAVVYSTPSIAVGSNNDEHTEWVFDAYNLEEANIPIQGNTNCFLRIVLVVSAAVAKYEEPTVTLNYSTVPSDGGTVYPTYEDSLEYTINGVSLRPINTGANLLFIIL